MFNCYEDIMSPEECSEALYTGKNTIYALLASGELKGFKMGRIWKIPRESLEQYVRNCTGLKNK